MLLTVRRRTSPPEPRLLVRAVAAPPELRDNRRVCFYAAVFDSPTAVSEHGEEFTEVVRPGAFARALALPTDYPATLEHDAARTFARRSTGLLLQEDPRGLFCTAYLPPSPANDRILDDVRHGRLTGASFMFADVPGGRRRTRQAGGGELHEVTDLDLRDVCLSAGHQVYKATSVSLRSRPVSGILELRLRRQRLVR